jgi:hypothetical protein
MVLSNNPPHLTELTLFLINLFFDDEDSLGLVVVDEPHVTDMQAATSHVHSGEVKEAAAIDLLNNNNQF